MAMRVNQVEKAARPSNFRDPSERLDEAVLSHGIGLVDPDVLPAHHPYPPLVALNELAEGILITIARPQDERVVPDARSIRESSMVPARNMVVRRCAWRLR